MPTGIDADLQVIDGGLYDLQIGSDGDILTEDSFDTAIIVSLFSDRRANESEVAASHLRRGWIGNESTPGIEIGSKIWLYEQSRLTATTLAGLSDAARDALTWLVEDRLAQSLDAVRATVSNNGINLEITIRRPNSEVERRLFELWENTGV